MTPVPELDTPGRLRTATLALLRREGATALSARAIAAEAGVNQALIFYHFGTVNALVAAASDEAVAQAVARQDLDAVTTMPDLLALAARVRTEERAAGNTRVMAQMLWLGRGNDVLAEAARRALRGWTDAVEPVLLRCGVPPAQAQGTAALLTAAAVGIELVAGVDPELATLADQATSPLPV